MQVVDLLLDDFTHLHLHHVQLCKGLDDVPEEEVLEPVVGRDVQLLKEVILRCLVGLKTLGVPA